MFTALSNSSDCLTSGRGVLSGTVRSRVSVRTQTGVFGRLLVYLASSLHCTCRCPQTLCLLSLHCRHTAPALSLRRPPQSSLIHRHFPFRSPSDVPHHNSFFFF